MPQTTQSECCTFLSDRWGEIAPEDERKPEFNAQAVEQLRAAMTDEITFIGSREGRLGLIFELEYDDNWQPSPAQKARLSLIGLEHNVPVWFTSGDHTFNSRTVIRAFMAAEQADQQRAERLGKALSQIFDLPGRQVEPQTTAPELQP